MRKNILYISFLGILEPVAFSQVFTYIIKLSEDKNLKFTLLTVEKDLFLKREDYLELQSIKEALKKNGVDWHILKYHRKMGKLYDLFAAFAYSMYLIKKNKINIIHARSSEPAALTFFISKIFKVKIVYDRRGMMAEDYSDDATTDFKIKKGGIFYRMIDAFERRIMRSCGAIVVLTKKMRDYLMRENCFNKKNNIFVIPCCVDLDRFGNFLKNNQELLSALNVKERFIFNYSGSICNLHCFIEMLDFFKAAKGLIPHAHFMFLTLADKKIIEAQINSRGLDIKDFTIMGTSPLNVNKYLSICDASAMFFKPAFVRTAASPTKVAECLASGLPIIINKGIGDTEELIEKNKVGVILEDFSEPSYLKALRALLILLSEPDIRIRCRNTAIENLSLKRGTERYRYIYDTL